MARLVRSAAALAAGALLLAAAPARLAAQERSAFVVRLGSDTTAVERAVRTAQRLEGDLLVRTPRTQVIHYVATLDGQGRVTRFEASSPATAAAPAQRSVLTFGDSVRMELVRGDSTRRVALAVPAGAVATPMLPTSFALYDQLLRVARRLPGDSARVALVFPGAREPSVAAVVRRGRDSVTVDFFGSPFLASVGSAGELRGLSGRETTLKVEVARVDDAPVERLAQEFAARDAAGQSMGQLSPRDTVRATVAGAELLVDYGRPAKRGRQIWGGIVPWGEVWRTGANAATQLRTSRDLAFGDVTVPAGTYTLWTLPTAGGAQLIVNRQTGQWGTAYDASQDLARVPLRPATPAAPAERFTISVEPGQGRGGVLRMVWDDRGWEIPFTVR